MATKEESLENRSTQPSDTVATIARCWRYPEKELVAALDEGLFENERTTNPTVDQLQQEYTRLFIGPGDPPCHPYESVYRNNGSDASSGQVLGESTKSVVDWYRRYDLMADSAWNDLPDHIAVELEFAGYLKETDPNACEAFLNEHPRQWIDEFLTDVEAHAEIPFYRDLATVTKQVISATD